MNQLPGWGGSLLLNRQKNLQLQTFLWLKILNYLQNVCNFLMRRVRLQSVETEEIASQDCFGKGGGL